MLENPDFEQNNFSITSTGIYKIGHDSIRLMKWICFYDRSYYDRKINNQLFNNNQNLNHQTVLLANEIVGYNLIKV